MFGGVSLYIVSREEDAGDDKQVEGHSKEGAASLGEAMWAAAAGAGGLCCSLPQAVGIVSEGIKALASDHCDKAD